MKSLKWCAIAALLAVGIAGCRLAYKRPRTKPPRPPTPAGVSTNQTVAKAVRPKKAALSYVPTDFALTSVRKQGNTVVLYWQNGVPPFQPQWKPTVLSQWENFGPSTSLRSVTNAVPYSGATALFRIGQGNPTPGTVFWGKLVQSTQLSQAGGVGIVKDQHGNVITAGNFYGTLDFGTGPITSHNVDNDVFIAKYNPQGQAVWVKTFGTFGADTCSGIAIDSGDNIIVTGRYVGSVDFGGTTLTNYGNGDIYVAKYSSTVNPPTLIWVKHFGGQGSDDGKAVTVAANGDVYFTAAYFSSSANFGGPILIPTGGGDIALAKLDRLTGNTIWAKSYGGSESEQPTCITTDNAGNVWLGGTFFASIDLGTGPKPNRDPGGSTSDFFLAKYSGVNGTAISARTVGGLGNDKVAGLTHSVSGDQVYAVGSMTSTADFGTGPVIVGDGAAAFVASYGAAGNHLWVKTWGGDVAGSTDSADGVGVDADTIATSGNTASFINFGEGPLPGSGYTMVTFRLNGISQPTYRWSRRASFGKSVGTGVVFDGLGHLGTCGSLQSFVDFGDGVRGIVTPFFGSFTLQHAK